MTDDNSSIIDELERVTEAAEAQGFKLRRRREQPYGWELYKDTHGAVTHGSLDELEKYLKRGNRIAAMLRRVPTALTGANR